MKTLILTILFTFQVLAQNSVTIKKGEVADFDGHLVKKERLVELIKAEKKNIVLKDLAYTQEEITEYHKDQAREYRKKLRREEFRSFWVGVGYFTLGVLVTGFAFKMSNKIDAL